MHCTSSCPSLIVVTYLPPLYMREKGETLGPASVSYSPTIACLPDTTVCQDKAAMNKKLALGCWHKKPCLGSWHKKSWLGSWQEDALPFLRQDDRKATNTGKHGNTFHYHSLITFMPLGSCRVGRTHNNNLSRFLMAIFIYLSFGEEYFF